MKFNKRYRLYGDYSFRGDCPRERLEQITFFNRVREEYASTYGTIIVHIRNEGKRHSAQTAAQKAEGLTVGASDIIIPAQMPFVCELKRRDHTKSKFQPGQEEYLTRVDYMGGFAVLALGADAAWEAFHDWRKFVKPQSPPK